MTNDVRPRTTGMVELDRAECVALLGSVPVGRLVLTEQALPAVRPVGFRLLTDGVYLRTAATGLVHTAAEQGHVVAFEADDYDSTARYGWSVLVVGRAALVTESLVLSYVEDLVAPSWAGTDRTAIVRVPLELVTGRRVGGPVPVARPRTAVD
jgi:hypothetical protein